MTLYSQRDPKWKDIILGNSPIGQYGCLVTCLSMISDIRPDVLDSMIDSVKGYQKESSLLIWEKLDLIKGFDFIKRVRIYDNQDILNNLPCLVEVDGTPIGGSRHWILYIGNQKCWDPWDGKEKPTSSYKPVGYAIVKYSKPSEVQTPLITDQTKIYINSQYGEMEVQQIRSALLAKDVKISELEKRLENCESTTTSSTPTTQVFVENTASPTETALTPEADLPEPNIEGAPKPSVFQLILELIKLLVKKMLGR